MPDEAEDAGGTAPESDLPPANCSPRRTERSLSAPASDLKRFRRSLPPPSDVRLSEADNQNRISGGSIRLNYAISLLFLPKSIPFFVQMEQRRLRGNNKRLAQAGQRNLIGLCESFDRNAVEGEWQTIRESGYRLNAAKRCRGDAAERHGILLRAQRSTMIRSTPTGCRCFTRLQGAPVHSKHTSFASANDFTAFHTILR